MVNRDIYRNTIRICHPNCLYILVFEEVLALPQYICIDSCTYSTAVTPGKTVGELHGGAALSKCLLDTCQSYLEIYTYLILEIRSLRNEPILV